MDKLITRIKGANARHNHVRAMGLLFSMSVNTISIDNSEACSHIPSSGEWKVVIASAAMIQTAITRRMIRETTTLFGLTSRSERKELHPIIIRMADNVLICRKVFPSILPLLTKCAVSNDEVLLPVQGVEWTHHPRNNQERK